MRRLGLVVLVLAMGVSAPASAAEWERETGWWIRLVSWWTNPLTPALELEREIAAEGAYVDPDGRPRPTANAQEPTANSEEGSYVDPDGR